VDSRWLNTRADKEENENKQREKIKLGGKIMMVVEAFTQRPVTLWYTENDKSNDKRWWVELAAKLPENGLMIVDMGFFSFAWFDLLTEAKKFFLTRFRAGTSYKTKQVLSQGSHYRDEIIVSVFIYSRQPILSNIFNHTLCLMSDRP